MARVNKVDALPLCFQKLMVAQICGYESVTACSNDSILEFTASSAANTHPVYAPSSVCITNAIAA